jgi:5'-3' exonuclease
MDLFDDPKMLIIDADIIPYRISYVVDYHGNDPISTVDSFMRNLFTATDTTMFVAFYTSKNNFRAKDTTYKANRDKSTIPSCYPLVKNYLKEKYHVYSIEGVESDDACFSYQTQSTNTIICSTDKDLLQAPGEHYNFNSKKITTVTAPGNIKRLKNGKVKASGDYMLWFQMITGDSVDNIQGIKGKGPVTAYKLLKDKKPEELADTVKSLYKEEYGIDWKKHFTSTYNKVKMMDIPGITEIPVMVYDTSSDMCYEKKNKHLQLFI